MYRRPGDLKNHRKDAIERSKQYYRHRRGMYYSYYKNYVNRRDRQMVRLSLMRGEQPWTPGTGRNRVKWECW